MYASSYVDLYQPEVSCMTLSFQKVDFLPKSKHSCVKIKQCMIHDTYYLGGIKKTEYYIKDDRLHYIQLLQIMMA